MGVTSKVPPNIRVSGNKLVDENGQEFRCHGVDIQGDEYQCIHNNGFSEGVINQQYINALLSWNINCVRIPLNEDCLLGRAVVPDAPNYEFVGPKYLESLKNEIRLFEENGLVVILDLHWTHGKDGANQQWPMAGKTNAIAFWKTISKEFCRPGFMFDLFNEPFINTWQCWLNGGSSCGQSDNTPYEVVGMQSLVDTIREAGCDVPLLLGGLRWCNDMTGWLHFKPKDPKNQLVAAAHIYNFNQCADPQCWKREMWPLAEHVPLIISEFGEDDCQSHFSETLMSEADKAGVSYLAWAWFANPTCQGGPSIISSYDGTPNPAGVGIKKHLLSLGQSRAHASQPKSRHSARMHARKF